MNRILIPVDNHEEILYKSGNEVSETPFSGRAFSGSRFLMADLKDCKTVFESIDLVRVIEMKMRSFSCSLACDLELSFPNLDGPNTVVCIASTDDTYPRGERLIPFSIRNPCCIGVRSKLNTHSYMDSEDLHKHINMEYLWCMFLAGKNPDHWYNEYVTEIKKKPTGGDSDPVYVLLRRSVESDVFMETVIRWITFDEGTDSTRANRLTGAVKSAIEKRTPDFYKLIKADMEELFVYFRKHTTWQRFGDVRMNIERVDGADIFSEGISSYSYEMEMILTMRVSLPDLNGESTRPELNLI
jgi:hypothetical protein